jgi:hypothetical protein
MIPLGVSSIYTSNLTYRKAIEYVLGIEFFTTYERIIIKIKLYRYKKYT